MELRLVAKHFLNSREFDLGYWWIDGLTFEVAGAESDRELLAALIADPWYHHSYAEPRADFPDGDGVEIHGPFRVSAIRPEVFMRTDGEIAQSRLDGWLAQNGSTPAATDAFRDLVRQLLPIGYRIFELPDLGEASRHEWGWVVGSGAGFVE